MIRVVFLEMKILKEGLSAAKKLKAELLWVEVVSPETQITEGLSKTALDHVYKISLNASSEPEFNLELQFYLKTVVNISDLGWPFHLFFCVKNSRLLFMSPSLDESSMAKLSEDLLALNLVEGIGASEDFCSYLLEIAKNDHLNATNTPSVSNPPDFAQSIRDSIENPLIQSFNPKNGSFSGSHLLSVNPGAVRALRFLNSYDISSLKEVSIVQILRTPLWDHLDSLFFRFYDSQKNIVSSEKLLIPNLEMLLEMSEDVQKFKNPFVESCLLEGFKCLVDNFIGDKGEIYSVMSYGDSKNLFFESNDLIESLNAAERFMAQEFWGLKTQHALPGVPTTLQEFCKINNYPLVETQHKLLDIKNKLKHSRKSKTSEGKTKVQATMWQKALALFYVSELLDLYQNALTPSDITRIENAKSLFQKDLPNYKAENLRDRVCLALMNAPLDNLKLKDFIETSFITQQDRWSLADTEMSSSCFAIYLKGLRSEKRKQFLLESDTQLRLYSLKTLGVKGMGWMSYALEALENAMPLSLGNDISV